MAKRKRPDKPDGKRTTKRIVADVLKLLDGYLAKMPNELHSDGVGVATTVELRQHVQGARNLLREEETMKPGDWLLLELRMAVIQHCAALRAVTDLIGEEKYPAATARLDQATRALHATVRGQCEGVTMKCPECDSEQDVVAWVDDGKCNVCGHALEWPDRPTTGL